ncbi:MAG: zf-HC2 domain-containing protein [Acidobacteriota bacterium]
MTLCLNEEILQAYFDGELAPDTAASVLTHLTVCSTCSAYMREIEQASLLINSAFDDELPEEIPTAQLQARLEEALATTTASALLPVSVRLSFWRSLINLLLLPLKTERLLPRYGVLAATTALASIILFALVGELINRRWQTTRYEPKPYIVKQTGTANSAPTISEQHSTLTASDKPNQPTQVARVHHIARYTKPKANRSKSSKQQQQSMAISLVKHTKLSGNITLLDLETSKHLRQTQLLLRSFRNSSSEEVEADLDLAYEKQLSRELLNKNRLLRRSATNKEASRTEELLNDIEPLLLDIANLPDQPSQTEVYSIKELIHKQKIIATLQIHSTKMGY